MVARARHAASPRTQGWTDPAFARVAEVVHRDTTREEPEPVDLADVVTAAVNRVRIRAPGLTFTTELAPVVAAPAERRP